MGFLTDPYNWRLSNPDSVPVLLGAHIYITVLSMAIGLLIAFPIALLVARYRRAYLPVLTTAGIIYTLPSLAVLAFLVPFTGLSLATVLIPLVAYAQVVLIRNIVAAIRAVDPALVEVGRAMGMNAFQLQWRVVLPLALPVIIAGLRVATVTTIGIATLAPLVGTDDLGTMIFQGFNFSYNDEVVAGVIVVSLLAVVADLALLALQALLARGRQIVPAA
ncbi:MAG TPA: ABC transporter permease [Ktedonobacterales bacterium]